MIKLLSYLRVFRMRRVVAAWRKRNDPLKLAHAVRHLGEAYNYTGDIRRAEPLIAEALSIYRLHEHTRPLDLANAVRALAVIKDASGANEAARVLWLEARDLYAAVNVSAGVAESAARLALLTYRSGDARRSREYLDEARSAADAAKDIETSSYVREVEATLGR